MPQTSSTIEQTLPAELSRRLAHLKSQIRWLELLRGAGLFAAVWIAGMALGLLVDLKWELSTPSRLTILAGVLCMGAFAFWKFLLGPLVRRIPDSELAAVVETVHPDLDERLLSVVELNDPRAAEAYKGSAVMRTRLMRETLHAAARIDFTDSVSTRGALKWSLAGTLAVGLLLAPLLLSPSGYGLLLSRFFMPWGNYDSVGNLYFEIDGGSRVVARGNDVIVTAMPRWRNHPEKLPETVWLNWTDATGDSDRRRMDFDAAAAAYITTIPHVFHPFDFDVSTGRSRTRSYRIDVVDAPRIEALTLDVEPPAYTGLQAEHRDGADGDVTVFERSRVRFHLTFNKPLESARFHWIASSAATTNAAKHPPKDKPADRSFTLSDDHQSGTLTMTAVAGGSFAIRLKDRWGLGNTAEPLRRLIVTPDRPPELILSGSDQPRQARPGDLVPIDVTAKDDIGIAVLELHYEVLGGKPTVVPVATNRLGGRTISHQFGLDTAALKLNSGAVVTYRVRTADERPVPGPHIVWSAPRVLVIDQNATPPGSSELAAEQQRLRKMLDDIRAKLNANRKAVAGLSKQARDDRRTKSEFQHNDAVRSLSRKQRDLAGQVEQLAERFAQRPLFADLTTPTRDVARQDLTQTSKQLTSAADAPTATKAGLLDKTAQQLAAADNKLRGIEKQFDRRAKIERDLLELDRLAQNARNLAEEVQALQKMMSKSSAAETAAQRRKREHDLADRQRQLRNRQQELSRQLDDLLKRRPEVLDAARKQQLDRLASLSQKALRLAEPQELLAETLRQESARTAESVRPLLKQQQELTRKVEQLAAKLATTKRDTPKPPVTTPSQASSKSSPGNQHPSKSTTAAVARKAPATTPSGEVPPVVAAKPAAAPDSGQHSDRNNRPNKPGDRKPVAAASSRPSPRQPKASDKTRATLAKSLKAAPLKQAVAALKSGDVGTAIRRQRESAAALDRLAERLRTASQPTSTETQPDTRSKAASQSAGKSPTVSKPTSGSDDDSARRKSKAIETLRKLRKQQQSLARETARQRPSAKQTEALTKRQNAIVRQLAKLNMPNARPELKQAIRKVAAAIEALEQRKTKKIAASQKQAERALARLEKRVSKPATKTTPSPSQSSTGKPGSTGKQPNVAGNPAGPTTRQPATPTTGAGKKPIAEQLARLADEQRRLARRVARLDERASGSAQAPASQRTNTPRKTNPVSKSSAQSSPKGSSPGRPANAPKGLPRSSTPDSSKSTRASSSKSSPASPRTTSDSSGTKSASTGKSASPDARRTQADQRQLARDAARLALKTAERLGPNSPAAQQATEFARQSAQAAKQSLAGRFNAAGKTAGQAANAGRQTEHALGRTATPDNAAETSTLRRETAELAKRQAQLGKTLKRLADSPTQRRLGEQAGQQTLARETADLAGQLKHLAQRLSSKPLNLGRPGRQAGEAQQATTQAETEMNRAGDGLTRGNSATAARSAEQAARQLREAARRASGAAKAGQTIRSPVPSSVAEKVAEAVRRLAQAGRQLQQAASSPQSGQRSGQQAASAGTPPGRTGTSGRPSSSPKSSGQSPSGQSGRPADAGRRPTSGSGEDPSGLARSATRLRQAAQALRQAARQSRAGQQRGGRGSSRQAGGSRRPGQSHSVASPGDAAGGGADVSADLQKLNAELKRLSTREWGKLPGHLRTEILQAARKRPNSDYARLIKLYFREIATTPADRTKARNK